MRAAVRKRPLLVATISVVVLLVCLRFVLVIISPNGLYLDEGDSKKQVVSMTRHGVNTSGAAWPLMSINPSGGITTAPYLYPLTAWSSLFGTSDVSIRAFSQFVTILAIILTAYGAYIWRGLRYGYIALIVGLVLPWSWVSGNLAWDPVMVPLFISAGFVCFSLLARRRVASAWHRQLLVAAMTIAMVLAAYAYPPARVTAPLLLLAAVAYLWATRRISRKSIGLLVAAGAITVIPLALFMITPEGSQRSAALSVFGDGLLRGSLSFIANLLRLINPYHLFVAGDANLRHSAGFQGMLGWMAVAPIGLGAVAVFKRFRQSRTVPMMLCIAIIGILAGLSGSALTHEGQPHYLRATAAWPFFVLLISLGWEYIAKQSAPVKYSALIIGILASIIFIVFLAAFYPEASQGYFGGA